MKKALFGAVAVLCLALPACGGPSDPHEAFIVDSLALMNDMVTTLEGVSDKAGLEAAVPTLKAYSARAEALQKRMKEIGKPTADKEKALEEKYKPRMAPLMERLQKIMPKIGPLMAQVPEAAKAMESFPR